MELRAVYLIIWWMLYVISKSELQSHRCQGIWAMNNVHKTNLLTFQNTSTHRTTVAQLIYLCFPLVLEPFVVVRMHAVYFTFNKAVFKNESLRQVENKLFSKNYLMQCLTSRVAKLELKAILKQVWNRLFYHLGYFYCPIPPLPFLRGEYLHLAEV